jgi:hypothetical protein
MTIIVSTPGAAVTVQNVIDRAFRLIQVKGSDQVPTTQEYTDAIYALRGMLDSWSTDSLLIYQVTREQFTLTTTNPVTIGPSGTLNTTRPVRLVDAYFAATGNDVDFPVQIVEAEDYAAVRLKTLQAAYPTYLYCDYAYPLANLFFYPITTGGTLTLWSEKELPEYLLTSTELALPPGYRRAIEYNLAVELAPEYQVSAGPDVLKIATDSLATIKRKNNRTPTMQPDGALMRSGQRRYNVYRNG